MVHFDTMTLRHFADKILSKLNREPGGELVALAVIRSGRPLLNKLKMSRNSIIGDNVHADGDAANLERIYREIWTLTEQQITMLDKAGLLFRTDVDFTAALARYFPGHSEGLTMTGFDRQFSELMERNEVLGRSMAG